MRENGTQEMVEEAKSLARAGRGAEIAAGALAPAPGWVPSEAPAPVPAQKRAAVVAQIRRRNEGKRGTEI
jgi:hypothetical protein